MADIGAADASSLSSGPRRRSLVNNGAGASSPGDSAGPAPGERALVAARTGKVGAGMVGRSSVGREARVGKRWKRVD